MEDTKEERATIHERPEAILALVKEIVDKTEHDLHKIRTNAELVERQCNGEQFIDIQPDRYSIQEAWWSDVPRLDQNVMANLGLTWTTLLFKDRPSAYCVPAGPDVVDQEAAQVGTALIEYEQARLDYSNKMHRMGLYGCQHGTAGFKVFYNAIEDRVDTKVVTVFDFIIDNKEDYTTSDWIIFSEYIDIWHAKELYEGAGLQAEPQEEDYRNSAQEKCRGVKKQEIWYRPSFRYPNGLFACVVGDHVVESMVYPNVFFDGDGKPEHFLPIVLFKCRNQRGTAYGYSFLKDCVKLQRSINEITSRQFKMMRQTTAMKVFIPKSLSQVWDDNENGTVVFDKGSEESIKTVRWLEPAQASPQLNDQLDRIKAAIYEVAGLNQSTVGAESFASQSGKAKAYQAELDVQKSADAVKSLESMILRYWTLVLKNMQHYYSKERTISIAGEKGAPPSAVTFSSANLQGLTVRLEMRSASDATATVKQQNAQTALQAGLLDKPGYDKATDSPSYSLSRSVADGIIDQLLAGQTVEVTKETVDPGAFMSAVDERVEQSSADKNHDLTAKLLHLKTLYLQMVSQPSTNEDEAPSTSAPAEAAPGNVAPPLPQAGSVFQK